MRQMKSQSADLQRMRDEQHQKELDALRLRSVSWRRRLLLLLLLL